MATTALTFFATAEEQRAWLDSCLGDRNVYCLLNHLRESTYSILLRNDVRNLEFCGGASAARLYLARRDLADTPVWRTAGARKEVDFVRSRMIEVVPSLLVEDILLLGQLGIMASQEYENIGLGSMPLFSWFRHVARSFETGVGTAGCKLFSKGPDGVLYPSRMRVLVSPGTVNWWRAGRRLKQFAQSNIEFDLELLPTS